MIKNNLSKIISSLTSYIISLNHVNFERVLKENEKGEIAKLLLKAKMIYEIRGDNCERIKRRST